MQITESRGRLFIFDALSQLANSHPGRLAKTRSRPLALIAWLNVAMSSPKNKRIKIDNSKSGKRYTSSASKHNKSLVRLLQTIDEQAHIAVNDSFPSGHDQLFDFDSKVFERGINTLKSVNLLLDNGHWEMAQPLLRQLLELIANIEFLNKAADRNAEAFKFVKFGILQEAQKSISNMVYDKNVGRTIDDAKLQQIETLVHSDNFIEFRANTQNGSIKFVKSWCRRNMADLCQASANPLRIHQYKLLYSPWSEQVHAAPAALVTNLFLTKGDNWMERVVAEDDVRIHEAFSMAVTLFLELWQILPKIKSPAPGLTNHWLTKLNPPPATKP